MEEGGSAEAVSVVAVMERAEAGLAGEEMGVAAVAAAEPEVMGSATEVAETAVQG